MTISRLEYGHLWKRKTSVNRKNVRQGRRRSRRLGRENDQGPLYPLEKGNNEKKKFERTRGRSRCSLKKITRKYAGTRWRGGRNLAGGMGATVCPFMQRIGKQGSWERKGGDKQPYLAEERARPGNPLEHVKQGRGKNL